ncbi:MAG: SurA N-terminal domain-containing protein [Verrucomicrobiae bacterium]|nr:SurA N-terminal domain-containing protein [Verrucomicrobiae bacterium]
MNSNRQILLALLAMAVLPVSFPSRIGAAPVELNRIKAVVNGEPITQTMVDAAVQTQVQVWLMGNKGMVSRSEAEREIRRMEGSALDDLIDRNLILSEFKKLGGAIKDQYVDETVNRFITERFKGDKDKFMEELKKSGMTIAQFREIQRDQIAIQALRQKHGGEDVIPNTPWEKRAKYNEIKDEFASEGQPKVRIMSIPKQTSTSSQAEQQQVLSDVMGKLRGGADFGDLAKKHSSDSFASKGGYVGVLGKDVLNEGLTKAAYSLPTGQISQPLDGGINWHILKVDGRVGQKTPSFDELEPEIDKRLTIEKKQKALESWLKKLRRDANVRIYED